ncbi:unnamed protein product [Lactuca saligna]|uniref:Remorin C-terminal domain-containing protein n=1 Tax=Lactuca saligna TaxID=75948 RepID=A0AA36DYN9_LACSI|nr:unnamed protein product [Lactuca saligna]
MENFIKQMRVRFSGMDEEIEEEASRVRDQNTPSPRTRSFKGDNRKGQNWYRRQSSREPTYDYDSDYMESDEFRTAVAAAAFAIGSVEERRRTRRRRDDSLSKGKSKTDDGAVSVTRRARERISSSSSSSNNKMKNKDDNTVHMSSPSLLPKKSSESQEKVSEKPNRSSNTDLTGEAFGSSQFVKKTSDSFQKQSDKRKPETGLESSRREQPTEQLTFPATEVDRKHSQPTLEDVKADAWEKNEMERIKERYERLNAKILEWETEKKEKAQKKLSRAKDELGKKRARILQNYKTEIEMIDQIAEGARSQAEENQRKEIIKVKEKAEVIRITGKVPTKACLCF